MAGPALTGLYRGVVTDSRDPSGLHRLRVSVPVITGVSSVWAFPCFAAPGQAPVDVQTGDGVWVMFEGGDRAYPVWVGFYGTRAT
jgi:hypothetical protein